MTHTGYSKPYPGKAILIVTADLKEIYFHGKAAPGAPEMELLTKDLVKGMDLSRWIRDRNLTAASIDIHPEMGIYPPTAKILEVNYEYGTQMKWDGTYTILEPKEVTLREWHEDDDEIEAEHNLLKGIQ